MRLVRWVWEDMGVGLIESDVLMQCGRMGWWPF
jgi:hypothetical protein